MKRIFLVEDEKSLRNLLKNYLEGAGYNVSVFKDGNEAKEVIDEKVDLWVLDIMMPGMNGYELIKIIKERRPEIPVVFMSARSQEIDRVIGLEMGSDDYLPKPFLPRELVLRVNRILKTEEKKTEKEIIDLGSAEFHVDKRVLIIGNEIYNLANKEYDILLYFIKNKEKPLSRNEILDDVWGINYFGSERVVDDTVRRLRKKVVDIPIETVYGYGYKLMVE